MLMYRVVNPSSWPILFFGAILPIGLVMRMFGKDFLRLARDRSSPTYWLPRSDPTAAIRSHAAAILGSARCRSCVSFSRSFGPAANSG